MLQYSTQLRDMFAGFKYIVPIEWCTKEIIDRVGGKNASLGELARGGFNVPTGFAITTDAYKRFVDVGGIKEKISEILAENKKNADYKSFLIRELFTQNPLPSDIEDEIVHAYGLITDHIREKLGETSPSYAVRSSATLEDMPNASFAGQHDTYLFIRGEKAVLEKVVLCWSSLFSARAITYRDSMGISHGKAYMSVGVINMVDAKAAGVMFTLDPANGSRLDIVIESNFGLGESVVKGITSVDRFVVNKIKLQIKERSIQAKQVQVVYDEAVNEVVEKEIPAQMRNMPSLSDEEVIYLARQAKEIENYFGAPQDIEFAIHKSAPFPRNVFILQSRPETRWSNEQRVSIFTKQHASHVTDYLLTWFLKSGN